MTTDKQQPENKKVERLQEKVFIRGKIYLKTGLHIGGTNEQMGIGGVDNLIIRNPLNQKPIIPGSSLKGKMRALIELVCGKYNTSDDKLGDVGNDPFVTKLFGTSAAKEEAHASRLIVRDAELIVDERDDKWNNTDMLYSEAKTEVVINRLTSGATPRKFERVPAGAEFNMEMIINVVSDDDNVDKTRRELLKLLAFGMKLLEQDYLGGQGSRGYGKIEFKNLKITKVKFSEDLNTKEEKVPEAKKPFEKWLKEEKKNNETKNS